MGGRGSCCGFERGLWAPFRGYLGPIVLQWRPSGGGRVWAGGGVVVVGPGAAAAAAGRGGVPADLRMVRREAFSRSVTLVVTGTTFSTRAGSSWTPSAGGVPAPAWVSNPVFYCRNLGPSKKVDR